MNFNEKLFTNIHGNVDFENCIQLSVLRKFPELLRKINVNEQQLNEFCSFVRCFDSEVYYEFNTVLFPFFIFSKYTFIPFTQLDIESAKMERLDERLQAQKKFLCDCISKKDYRAFFRMVDKRVRYHVYNEIFNCIPDDQKYDCFVFIYISMETGFENITSKQMKLYTDYRFKSKKWENPEEMLHGKRNNEGLLDIYCGMPPGQEEELANYFSWSLSLKVAQFFANRFNKNGDVYKAQVSVDKVIDYINERKEEEIWVMFSDLVNVTKLTR